MKRFLKIVYWASISLISLFILTPILGHFIPVELADDEVEYVYESIRFFCFPIAIILTLTKTISPADARGIIVAKILLTIFAAVVVAYIIILSVFADMCDWSTVKVFFENKKNSSITIVERDFGCGATDSTSPIVQLFKVRKIPPFFIWVSEIDTNRIDKSEWIRIETPHE